MKYLFILIFLFSLTNKSFAGQNFINFLPSPILFVPNKTPNFNRISSWLYDMSYSNDVLTEISVVKLLEYRCFWYLKTHPIYTRGYRCSQLAKKVIKILDQIKIKKTDNSEKTTYRSVSFSTRLSQLFESPTGAFQRFIEGMHRDIKNSFFEFNLWESALNFSNDPTIAAEWIAVVFQDITNTYTTNKYLEELGYYKRDFPPHPLVHKFDEISKNMVRIAFNRNEGVNPHSNIKFLPQTLSSKLYPGDSKFNDLGFYHFYVPMYLAYKLKQGGASPEEAMIIPFLLNYIYEAIQAENLQYSFLEPSNFQDYEAREIYLGYLGAWYGVGKLHKAVPFSDAINLISKEPKLFLETLFH